MSKSNHQVQDVSVEIHRKPACRIELEVRATPALVAAARKEAIKRINKETEFPGFRKGRAPEEMVVKRYPGAIESEWHKAIADAAFAAAQAQARIPMLNTGASVSFDLKKHSLTDGAELSFSFETEPQVPTVDPKRFEAKPVETAEVGDKQIDEAIRQMRFFFAKWKPLEGRGIQDGDYITIDLETLGESPEKVFDQVRFEVTKERMADWMKQLVLGAKAGDVLEGVSEADASASEEEKKEFTPKPIRLTIHKAEEAELPELNDDFARQVGANDLSSMRDSVRTILQQNVNEKTRSALREQVRHFLIDAYSFELPLSLIDAEVKHRKSQMEKDPKFTSYYQNLSAEDRKKFDAKTYADASHAVQIFYLSRQIIRDAQIPVTHGEVQQEAADSARAFGQGIDPAHLPKEVFALALSKVILAKAQDYIIAQAQKETPAPMESPAEAAPVK